MNGDKRVVLKVYSNDLNTGHTRYASCLSHSGPPSIALLKWKHYVGSSGTCAAAKLGRSASSARPSVLSLLYVIVPVPVVLSPGTSCDIVTTCFGLTIATFYQSSRCMTCPCRQSYVSLILWEGGHNDDLSICKYCCKVT